MEKKAAKSSSSNEGNEIELQAEDLEQTLQKLQDSKQSGSESADIIKLKRLVITFKKKYKQALEELSLREVGQSANPADEEKSLQEALENNAALVEQQTSLKGLLLQEKELNLQLAKRIEHTEQENLSLLNEVNRLEQTLSLHANNGEGELKEVERLRQKLKEAEEVSFQLEKQKRRYEEVLGNKPFQGQDEGNAGGEPAWKMEIEKLKEEKFLLEKEYKEKLWLQKEELSLARQEAQALKANAQGTEDASSTQPGKDPMLAITRQEKEAAEALQRSLKAQLGRVQEELEAAKAELAHVKMQALGAQAAKSMPENSQSDLQRLKEENQTQRYRIEQLMKVISERERRVSELQKYEFSFKKVTEINQQYEREVASQKSVLLEFKAQNEAFEKALTETKDHSRQLELAVDHLRGKCEEIKLDAANFQAEFEKAEAQVAALKEEANLAKEKKEELQAALSAANEEREETLSELKLLTSQLELAKKDLKTLEDYVKGQTESLDDTSLKLQKAVEEKQFLEKELAEKQSALFSAEGELEMMKQTLVKGLKEAREIKQYYQNLANEKSAVLHKTTHMQQHIRELTEELKGRDRALEELQKQLEESRAELHEMELRLQREKEKHGEYDREIELREESLASFAEQIKTMQAKLKTAEEGSKEKELSVVEAQQQFAKKVREVQHLSEANEEMKKQLAKLQDELIESKSRVNESHANLEASRENMRKLQDQMGQMEKKYFKAYERLQEVEAQNKELKKVEQKHHQMQQLLANISSVVGSPIGLTQPYGLLPETSRPPAAPALDLGKKPEFKIQADPEQKKERRPLAEGSDQSLFDSQNPPSKFKKDFFEQ